MSPPQCVSFSTYPTSCEWQRYCPHVLGSRSPDSHWLRVASTYWTMTTRTCSLQLSLPLEIASLNKVRDGTETSFRAGAQVIGDYHLHFKGTERSSPAYRAKLDRLNQRIAQRLFHLCYQNGGIYTKLGQQLATFNHGLPKAYTTTLARLQDQAKPVSFDLVKQTIKAEMGQPWQHYFQTIDSIPIASASLAQVHRAVDYHGRELAVKVQYPHLETQMKADLRVIQWAFQLTEYFFPEIEIQWFLPEFQRALLSELNFENEKDNSRRLAACFTNNDSVYVPIVYDDLSTKRVLSMEFIRAPKISELHAIKTMGLDPRKVARSLCAVFSEMIFCHGFVHCDPHPGNIFVRQNPDPRVKRKEQIVLLDHGLYRELDCEFRKTYCDLWRAMLLRDRTLLDDCCKKLNVGNFARYMPLLFTYRSINHKGSLDAAMTDSERKKLNEDLRRLRFSNLTDFLEQLPPDMLFVFRTNNMIRALNKDLGGTTRERFSIMGNYAVSGHSAFYSVSTETGYGKMWALMCFWWEHLQLTLRFRVVDYFMTCSQYRGGKTASTVTKRKQVD
ncbi:hypothetical protein PsorP6_009535 [Peronosclerospora sorghi]|uniref:Uncharacterized protein n=1 Tax=Peronosclerospora sorghi TaxID=230839 RepID=A0ACC0VZW7_9STRA|nr:hypothetical protein PsorP6_009535 [Peronosclerospora sorghi]